MSNDSPRGRRKGRGRGRRNKGGTRSVPLHKRSSSHFEPGDRDRGADYFADGRVHLEVAGTRARARVEGGERTFYRVGVDWSQIGNRVVHAYCDCPRFGEGRPCKHVWAVLLALAESGAEHQPPGKDRISLRKDRAARWQDLGTPAPEGEGRPVRHERAARRRHGRSRGRDAGESPWRSQLENVRAVAASARPERVTANGGARKAEILLMINGAASQESGHLTLDVFQRRRNADGRPGRLGRATLETSHLEQLLQPAAEGNGTEAAAEAPPALVVALPAESHSGSGRGRRRRSSRHTSGIQRFELPERLYEEVLPRLGDEGVLAWWNGRAPGDPPALGWDDGPPWQLALRLQRAAGGAGRLTGTLQRGEESVALTEVEWLLPAQENGATSNGNPDGAGLVLIDDRLARLDATRDDGPWIQVLRDAGEIVFPRDELEEGLAALLDLPHLPLLEGPDDMPLSEERADPHPRLVLEALALPGMSNPPLLAELSFLYHDLEVNAADSRPSVVDWDAHQFVRRDLEKEHQAVVRLVEVGLKPVETPQGHELQLPPQELAAVAEPLLQEGWTVEVHGRSLRGAGPPALRIESGIDWFQLQGEVEFAGDKMTMDKVLEAISRGERFVDLGDGSQGLLPATLVETYDSLAKLAHDSTEDGLRFATSQAMLVDWLLAAMPPAQVDQAFAEVRKKLASFDRIQPVKEARGFRGELRAYQRDGLGWLGFLREFGLGGVLADDMGLGKTVQVLALLHANRMPSTTTGLPSLVVAPRSLVYNWIDEAARFTPKLKVVEYHGTDREALQPKIGEFDLVVTTYGTLRRDIGFLATVEFDTIVLDEAQAIKNPESQTAKASRLLVGRHRLALTGTPIENHLGELGSLFEFLNPGLLGRLPKLDVLASGGAPSKEQLALVSKGIRPFILRRTKAQVLADLPPKTEQVLFCSLRPEQRELYDALAAQYRAQLLEQVESEGVGGSTIQVLEALLRLRQLACHPGLVSDEWEEAGSAKLEALFEQVDEVLDEGHKVLVFSQFTSFLAYVRRHLDEQQVGYAYLDGQTRDRAEPVERFQTDPACNVFLVSLKAGGLGLNLTAAEYVFLLDPWWNPAVEAQAIDRAHRIGQTQPVFAYRLIARNTVEEKVLDLQRSKRQLADAVLEGEGADLKELTADDLRMLLS